MPRFQQRKRKRTYNNGRVTKRRRIRPAQRGFVRTSGFYGRYALTGGELKFFDGTSNAVPAAGGTIMEDSLNHITQGVTEQARVGRKCTLRSIQARFQLTLASTPTAANTSERVRLIIYQDKQANGATATVTGIMESATLDSYRNLANGSRFRVLYNKVVVMNTAAGSGRGTTDTLSYSETTAYRQMYKKCNIPLEFDSTTGAITELRSNNIGYLAFTDTGLVDVEVHWRLRFSDGN